MILHIYMYIYIMIWYYRHVTDTHMTFAMKRIIYLDEFFNEPHGKGKFIPHQTFTPEIWWIIRISHRCIYIYICILYIVLSCLITVHFFSLSLSIYIHIIWWLRHEFSREGLTNQLQPLPQRHLSGRWCCRSFLSQKRAPGYSCEKFGKKQWGIIWLTDVNGWLIDDTSQ